MDARGPSLKSMEEITLRIGVVLTLLFLTAGLVRTIVLKIIVYIVKNTMTHQCENQLIRC